MTHAALTLCIRGSVCALPAHLKGYNGWLALSFCSCLCIRYIRSSRYVVSVSSSLRNLEAGRDAAACSRDIDAQGEQRQGVPSLRAPFAFSIQHQQERFPPALLIGVEACGNVLQIMPEDAKVLQYLNDVKYEILLRAGERVRD
jgi:hypothetical protein